MNSVVLSEQDISRAVTRITHEILEKNKGATSLVLVGIRTRGATLAKRIEKKINDIEGIKVGLGVLDVTLYRDDLSAGKQNLVIEKTSIPFALEGKQVVLIDDVLFTGRSIRAAMSSIDSYGRPKSIELMVLIDRRFKRELPIEANYFGAKIDTIKGDKVSVIWGKEKDNDVVYIER